MELKLLAIIVSLAMFIISTESSPTVGAVDSDAPISGRQGILEIPKQIATIIRNTVDESLERFFTTPKPITPSPVRRKTTPSSDSKLKPTRSPEDTFVAEFIINNFIDTTKSPSTPEKVPAPVEIKTVAEIPASQKIPEIGIPIVQPPSPQENIPAEVLEIESGLEGKVPVQSLSAADVEKYTNLISSNAAAGVQGPQEILPTPVLVEGGSPSEIEEYVYLFGVPTTTRSTTTSPEISTDEGAVVSTDETEVDSDDVTSTTPDDEELTTVTTTEPDDADETPAPSTTSGTTDEDEDVDEAEEAENSLVL